MRATTGILILTLPVAGWAQDVPPPEPDSR
jgi:hypothetical protein